MAKKITLVVFLAVLIAGSIFQSAYLLGVCEEFSALSDQMKVALDLNDFEQVEVICEDISTKFSETRSMLASLLQHGELDLLGIEVVSLQVAVEARQEYEIFLALERIEFCAEQIAGTDRTVMENIL